MIFTRYTSAEAFAGEVTEILMRHEIQNNLFFINMRGGSARTDNAHIFMATVKNDSGDILLTSIGTPPYPTLLFETDNRPNDEALEFFTLSLVNHDIDISLVMAEMGLAKRFSSLYGRLSDKRYEKKESLVLYVLERANALLLPEGRYRKAEKSDMYYLPYWLSDFAVACHLGDYDLAGGMGTAEKLIEEGNAYIWEDGGPVAFAAQVRRTSNCGFIGQVYTPPHLRGKGYSTACVWHLSQRIFDSGMMYCGLYADCANPFSNKVYQNIGYRAVSYSDQYMFA